jgi:hypothetical protein
MHTVAARMRKPRKRRFSTVPAIKLSEITDIASWQTSILSLSGPVVKESFVKQRKLGALTMTTVVPGNPADSDSISE